MVLATDPEARGTRILTALVSPRAWLGLDVAVASTLAWLLWATSTPAWAYFDILIGLALLGVLGLAWFVLAVAVAFGQGRIKAAPTRHLLVAPMLVVVSFMLVATAAPLRVRWALSRNAFDGVVAGHVDGSEPSVDATERIGLYDIERVLRTGDGVIFYESHGGLFDESGFACLPSGPGLGLESTNLENPRFEHLDGCWYTWSAGW